MWTRARAVPTEHGGEDAPWNGRHARWPTESNQGKPKSDKGQPAARSYWSTKIGSEVWSRSIARYVCLFVCQSLACKPEKKRDFHLFSKFKTFVFHLRAVDREWALCMRHQISLPRQPIWPRLLTAQITWPIPPQASPRNPRRTHPRY